MQRSVTVYGDREDVEARRRELAGTATLARASGRPSPALTVGELLERWLAVDHGWRPSTLVGYRSNVRFLATDPLAQRRVSSLTPAVVWVPGVDSAMRLEPWAISSSQAAGDRGAPLP